MGGVDLATVKEILGHREIEMTLRYSHLAPAHKARAVEKLGEVLENITSSQREKSEEKSLSVATNLAQIRNVFLVRSGRGLAVVQQKTHEDQVITRPENWWRRGELNCGCKRLILQEILSSKFACCPQSCPHAAAFTTARFNSSL
jgi:hypothetical protein